MSRAFLFAVVALTFLCLFCDRSWAWETPPVAVIRTYGLKKYPSAWQEVEFSGEDSYDQDDSGCRIEEWDWSFSAGDPRITMIINGGEKIKVRFRTGAMVRGQYGMTVPAIGITMRSTTTKM
jgi:hypothetical protein